MNSTVQTRLGAALLLAGITFAQASSAQTFLRVTDPGNPIANDLAQSGGGSWIDLVGDGYLDLFVANGNVVNQPNALYRNTRAGGFARVVTGPVAVDGGTSIGGTFGDFDNDGLPDLFVTNRNNFGNFLYRGLGDTAFARILTGPPATNIGNSNSSSWVDLDNDGNLDLYVVNFAGNDFLYLNGGAPLHAFSRVDTTLLTTGSEFSIPGAWADYNNDGLEDLFVGNAGTQNDYVYVNHGHLFFTRTTLSDAASTLGASWGDYDNDGNLDLVVAHYQGQKSTLYHNSGSPLFQLVPVDTSIVSNDPGSWVGSSWGDYDNDGSLDLYMANDGGAGALYHNSGPPGYGFTKVTTGPVATDVSNRFGAVWGDYDRDGQLDLFVARGGAPGNSGKNLLYHNAGNPNHWLTVRCAGTISSRTALGAKIRVFATISGAPRSQLREVTGQTGYNSQNLDQHFGLGDVAFADSLRVEWPSGIKETWKNVAGDTLLKLTEGSAPVGVGGPPPALRTGLVLEPAGPNPFRAATELGFALPRAGRARIEILDVSGRRVALPLDRDLAAGRHSVRFDAPRSAPAGIYFCRLTCGGEAATLRLALIR